MGFSEIYLIGMDNSYSVAVMSDGTVERKDMNDHFDKSYKASMYPMSIEIINAAYSKALQYCKSHGIKVYNATRGGELEVFDRVNFMSLF